MTAGAVSSGVAIIASEESASWSASETEAAASSVDWTTSYTAT